MELRNILVLRIYTVEYYKTRLDENPVLSLKTANMFSSTSVQSLLIYFPFNRYHGFVSISYNGLDNRSFHCCTGDK